MESLIKPGHQPSLPGFGMLLQWKECVLDMNCEYLRLQDMMTELSWGNWIDIYTKEEQMVLRNFLTYYNITEV